MNQQKIVPNSLREYRNRIGLRQIDVAKKLGFCNTNRISRWEKGLSIPSIVNVFRLCIIYNTSPEKLYSELFKKYYGEMQYKKKNLEIL